MCVERHLIDSCRRGGINAFHGLMGSEFVAARHMFIAARLTSNLVRQTMTDCSVSHRIYVVPFATALISVLTMCVNSNTIHGTQSCVV